MADMWSPTLYDLLSVYVMATLSFPLLIWSAGYALAVTLPEKARRAGLVKVAEGHWRLEGLDETFQSARGGWQPPLGGHSEGDDV